METEHKSKEKNYIRNNYKVKTQMQIAEKLNIAQSMVSTYMLQMGLRKSKKLWSHLDTVFLRKNIDMSNKQLEKLMQYSADTIQIHRNKLNAVSAELHFAKPIGKPAPGWKPL